MSVKVLLVGRGGRVVEVSENGVVATGPLKFSTGKFQDMNVVNTAFNLRTPIAGQQLVITGMLISTDRSVGANGAVIEIYEASADDSITVVETILRIDMTKNKELPLFGLDRLVSKGAFVNGKTDDASVLVSLFGYEIDA